MEKVVANFSGIPAIDSLEQVTTLCNMLAFRAAHTPNQEACYFEGESLTHILLWERINRVAAFLKQKGVESQDRVVLVIPNGLEFFPAFYGVQRLGGIAVPLFPGSGPQRILKIIQLSNARAIIVPSGTPAEDLANYRQVLASLDCAVYTFDACVAQEVSATETFPELDPEDLAFFQYTSGSTGDSKGVQLSHRNLVANLRQMIAASEMNEADVLVSWLPVYHDLGLILMTMAPFYIGARLILLPTTLTNLGKWLSSIQDFKGTYTAAPDIAYRMCVKQIRDTYDLSTLRIAINAAEPIRVSTIREFEEKFNLRNIVKPGYGLAEASVGVTFWGLGDKPIKADERGFVAIGSALLDIDIQIVKDDQIQPPNQIGDIVFRSPSATRGYFKNPEATEKLFWRDGYLFTGDLGYFDDDHDLFIVARAKNVIKQGGRTLAPREVEEIVDAIPRIRYTAAVGVDRKRQEGEQVYVFAETRMNADKVETDAPLMIKEIVQRIHANLGFRPGRVYLVKPHTIPFTYNGKIQHAALRQRYLDGSLANENLIIYPNY
jgi:acyl-CoA synthetase (AMP-forming)/AMP-acid ligase II